VCMCMCVCVCVCVCVCMYVRTYVQEIILFSVVSGSVLGPIQFPVKLVSGGSLRGGKATGGLRITVKLHPNADVKTEWNCTSFPYTS